jgi:hypothetical protein
MRSIRQQMLHLGLWPQTMLAASLGFVALVGLVLRVHRAVATQWRLGPESVCTSTTNCGGAASSPVLSGARPAAPAQLETDMQIPNLNMDCNVHML